MKIILFCTIFLLKSCCSSETALENTEFSSDNITADKSLLKKGILISDLVSFYGVPYDLTFAHDGRRVDCSDMTISEIKEMHNFSGWMQYSRFKAGRDNCFWDLDVYVKNGVVQRVTDEVYAESF